MKTKATMREGIRVEVSGPTGLKDPFIVSYQYFGEEVPTKAKGKGARLRYDKVYFDFFFDGLTGGEAIVRITHDSVTEKHKIQHYNTKTGEWVDHPEAKVVGKTISAEFTVPQLHKTPIVIGHN